MKNLTALKVTYYFVTLGLITSCGSKPYVQANLKLAQDTTAFGDPKSLDTLETSENNYQICLVRNMQWTPGSAESILLEPTDWIFPGNVLDAKSLQDGAYTTIAGDRKSINLVIDGQIFNKMSVKVPSPGQKSIKDSITSMLKSGKIGSQPADVNISAKEVYSEEHLKLMIRSKYSGGFGSLSAGFDFNNTNISSRYLLDVTQVYYTINTETPLNGFFNKKPELLTDSSSAPVYISSIKYGRRVMIIVETQKTDEQTEADFKAQFNAVASSGSLDVTMFSNKFFSDKSVKILVKGGNADNTYKFWKAVSNKEEIIDILAKDAQWSLDNLGVPLAYQVRNTSDNSNFYISQTGTYKARMCTIKSQNDTTINVNPIERLCAWHVGGNDRNFGDNPDVNFSIKLEPDENIVRCKIEVFMKEPGGDGTAGSVIVSRNVIELPEDYTIIKITSPIEITQPTIRLKNKGQNPFPFDTRYPVSLVSIIGDSDDNNDDDLFPGACGDDIHAQIRNIVFNPISIRYTRKAKKAY
tara:strand:+ start:2444 stop:4018 length:1575 start_codon:yes stop_codon:yes gene_type:complete